MLSGYSCCIRVRYLSLCTMFFLAFQFSGLRDIFLSHFAQQQLLRCAQLLMVLIMAKFSCKFTFKQIRHVGLPHALKHISIFGIGSKFKVTPYTIPKVSKEINDINQRKIMLSSFLIILINGLLHLEVLNHQIGACNALEDVLDVICLLSGQRDCLISFRHVMDLPVAVSK